MPDNPFPVRIDIKTAPQHTTYDTIRRYWQDAEREPAFTGGWLFDHFMPLGDDPTGPCLEGWTLLAALAATTGRLRLGIMVTGNGYRHPAVLAKMAATVDVISDGRLDFGIGAGWFEPEYEAYGIPFPSAADRIRAMGEACQVAKLLWTRETSDFEGRYYTLKGARCEPRPVQKPYPPFVIGGQGEHLTLREVARHADIYNAPGIPPDRMRHKLDVLEEHCRAIARDSREIRYSWQIVLRSPDELEGLSERLLPYLQIGIDHFVIGLPGKYEEGMVSALAREVAPLLEMAPQRNTPQLPLTPGT